LTIDGIRPNVSEPTVLEVVVVAVAGSAEPESPSSWHPATRMRTRRRAAQRRTVCYSRVDAAQRLIPLSVA
jgi:hypothetical protein